MIMLIVNVLITAINLGVLALSIKLYTEVLKDQSQNRRADAARARKEGGAA